jgi:cell division protein FtsB
MNEIIIVIIIVIILIAVLLSGRKQRLAQAESEIADQHDESKSWAKETVMSERQVQQLHERLIRSVEEKFARQPEDLERLKEIINDWAELKIKSFRERRSWVRRPDQTETE